MDKRMFNGHCHNPLDFNNNFSAIDSSRCAMSSLYDPSKLFPLSTPPLPSTPSPTTSPSVGVGGGGSNYIEHPINKFDTLAGLAIKYGVEVAAIKKLNGLLTDHQMFARKTLHIPLDGRHPPIVSDSSDNHGPQKQNKSVTFDSFKLDSSSLLNLPPAMTSQQGYYGHERSIEKAHSEGLEMAMYLKRGAHYSENGATPPLSHHRKCKSVAYDLHANNGVAKPPETLLKAEVITGSGFSPLGTKASKGLALRPKSGARTMSGVENEGGFPIGLGNSAQPNVFSGVRRSSSTPSLQDASVTKPIFDGLGLGNPIPGKKSKAG